MPDSSIDGELVCPDLVRFVAGADLLFRLAPAICDLAAIDRIIEHILHEVGGKGGQHVVLPELLRIAVMIQILRDGSDAVARMHIPVEDDADDFGFVLGDQNLSVFELIAIGSKTAVPLAFTGLLLTSGHGLHADVFTLDLCDGGENGDHLIH